MNRISYDESGINGSKLMKVACKKRDKEAMAYLDLLDRYLKVPDRLYDDWDYPTKSEIAERASDLKKIAAKAACYKGTRFRQQYQLLGIRCAFSLNDWSEVERLWMAADKSHGVFKDMMENYYAGSLYRLKRLNEAADIYARQGDLNSAYFCNLEWGDAAGIQNIYNLNPNSGVLPWLIKQFCDETQETFDNIRDGYITEENDEAYGYRKITDKVSREFVDIALGAIADRKSDDLLMWVNAAALVSFYKGDFDKARDILDSNRNVSSSKASRRCNDYIRVFVNLYADPDKALTQDVVASNLALLDSDGKNDQAERMLQRYVYMELMPRLRDRGDVKALLTALSISNPGNNNIYTDEAGYWSRNLIFSSPYFSELDSLPITALEIWKEWLASGDDSALRKYALKRCSGDDMMLTELVGTRLMREGKFREAKRWLVKVPSEYISVMNVSPFMACRDFRKIPWIAGRERTRKEYHITRIKNNPKVEYCDYVLGLERAAYEAKGTPEEYQADIALAAAYYQASPYGPCWWLTRYSISPYATDEDKTPEAGDKDFSKESLALVKEALMVSKLPSERLDALYAKAYITPGWFSTYDWESGRQTILYDSDSYRAYRELDKAMCSLIDMPDYISRCDILQTFRALPPSPMAYIGISTLSAYINL